MMKRNRRLRRCFSAFLAVVMCLGMVNTIVFAEEDHTHNKDGWSCEWTEPVTEPDCRHEHDEACYSPGNPVLSCGEDHHTEDCYVPGEDVLTCEDESEEHEHTDGCCAPGPPVLSCGNEHHTEGCYTPGEDVLVCTHEHSEECVRVVAEGYWTCTEPEVKTEEETPAEVQAFLDSVAALPSPNQVTQDNAEAIGDLVNEVLDMWDAMSVENSEREDVTEALDIAYAVYAAVLDAAGVGEEASTYSNWLRVTPPEITLNVKVSSPYGSLSPTSIPVGSVVGSEFEAAGKNRRLVVSKVSGSSVTLKIQTWGRTWKGDSTTGGYVDDWNYYDEVSTTYGQQVGTSGSTTTYKIAPKYVADILNQCFTVPDANQIWETDAGGNQVGDYKLGTITYRIYPDAEKTAQAGTKLNFGSLSSGTSTSTANTAGTGRTYFVTCNSVTLNYNLTFTPNPGPGMKIFHYAYPDNLVDGVMYITHARRETAPSLNNTGDHATLIGSGYNYELLGWSTEPNAETNNFYRIGDPLSEDGECLYTVYGRTLSLDGNAPTGKTIEDSSMPGEQYQLSTDMGVEVPSEQPICRGCRFLGWNTTSSGSGELYQPGERIFLERPSALYAQWQETSTGIEIVSAPTDCNETRGCFNPNDQVDFLASADRTVVYRVTIPYKDDMQGKTMVVRFSFDGKKVLHTWNEYGDGYVSGGKWLDGWKELPNVGNEAKFKLNEAKSDEQNKSAARMMARAESAGAGENKLSFYMYATINGSDEMLVPSFTVYYLDDEGTELYYGELTTEGAEKVSNDVFSQNRAVRADRYVLKFKKDADGEDTATADLDKDGFPQKGGGPLKSGKAYMAAGSMTYHLGSGDEKVNNTLNVIPGKYSENDKNYELQYVVVGDRNDRKAYLYKWVGEELKVESVTDADGKVESASSTDADGNPVTKVIPDPRASITLSSAGVPFEAYYIIEDVPTTGSIKITKKLADGSPEEAKNKEYTFTVTKVGETSNAGTIAIKPGNAGTVDDLLTGTYTIKETGGDLTGYKCAASFDSSGPWTVEAGKTTEVTITNTYTETTELTVKKVWNDEEDAAKVRPKSVSVQLLCNGKESGSPVELNEVNSWSYKWSDLDVKNATGTINKWTVDEVEVPEGYKPTQDVTGSVVTITNTYTPNPDDTSLTVNKVWNDAENAAKVRPKSVSVQLLCNGKESGSPVELNQDNNWSHTWWNLPVQGENGTVNKWTVTEVKVPAGYTSSQKTEDTVVTITNTYKPTAGPGDPSPTPVYTRLSVNKVWNDNNDAAGKRPESISVQLFCNGMPSGSPVTLNQSNGWSREWTDLVKKDTTGEENVWTVEEVAVADGYAVSQSIRDGVVVITNTYTPKQPDPTYTSLAVSKAWDDQDNAEGKRPDNISIQLLCNGEPSGAPVTLSRSNGWSCEWLELAKKDADGNVNVWTVEEVTVAEGYTSSQATIDGVIIITNTYAVVTEHPPEDPPPPDLPDPNDPDSPDIITVVDDGVPTTYIKVWDPDDKTWVYIPEEDVPKTNGDPEDNVPETGDDSWVWTVLALASGAGLIWLTLADRKRRTREK